MNYKKTTFKSFPTSLLLLRAWVLKRLLHRLPLRC